MKGPLEITAEENNQVRVTNQVLLNQALGSTRDLMSEFGDLQRAVTSGLRVERPSDDPAAAGGIMRTSSSLRALEQYRENLDLAQSRLSLENGVMDQVTNVLIRVKELAISQAGSTASADTRSAVQAEVDELHEFLVGLGNTQFAGSYLFGGDYADSIPFTITGIDPARPPAGDFKVEGGAGTFYLANHSGQEILVDTHVLEALEAVSQALGNNSAPDIQAALSDMDVAIDEVQVVIAELGARINRVDHALENLGSLEVELLTQRSDLQDTDMEEAITRLVNRQVTYESAMLANSRILNLTLTDYLR
jgi:flagellar hook-associated protein 3 FlgL